MASSASSPARRQASSTTEDAAAVGEILEPGSAALMIVYENLWSLPFTRAAQMAGGQLVASGRIPVQAIVARLDELGA